MKLEFQKCLSAMDRCLVLPHAVSRAKIHSALAARRRESEEKMVSEHTFVLFFTKKQRIFFFSGLRNISLNVRCFPAACLLLEHAVFLFIATCKFMPGTLEKKCVQNNPAVPEHEPGAIRTLI